MTTHNHTLSSPGSASASHQFRRARWMRQLLQWHWITSAVCLVGMLLFAFTGITLNHSGSLESSPQRSSETRT